MPCVYRLRNEYLGRSLPPRKWSYLSTATNDVSLAQNLCYRLHSDAELIVKIDEDIFLLEDTISTLVREHRLIKAKGVVDPGCVAPIIPINRFCYWHLLERLGWLDEYEARFGRARIACSGIAIQNDPAAARWMAGLASPAPASPSRMILPRPAGCGSGLLLSRQLRGVSLLCLIRSCCARSSSASA